MTAAQWQSIVLLLVIYDEFHMQAIYAQCRFAECRGAKMVKRM